MKDDMPDATVALEALEELASCALEYGLRSAQEKADIIEAHITMLEERLADLAPKPVEQDAQVGDDDILAHNVAYKWGIPFGRAQGIIKDISRALTQVKPVGEGDEEKALNKLHHLVRLLRHSPDPISTDERYDLAREIEEQLPAFTPQPITGEALEALNRLEACLTDGYYVDEPIAVIRTALQALQSKEQP